MFSQNFSLDHRVAPMSPQMAPKDRVKVRDRQPVGPGFRLYENVTNLIRERRYTAALLELVESEPRLNQEARFWHLQGEVLANLNRYQDALESFDQALEIDPVAVNTLVFKAVCWIHLQKFERALACCDLALVIKPSDSQAWLFKGVALQRLGQYRSAYSSYDHALGQKPPSFFQQVVSFFKDLFSS